MSRREGDTETRGHGDSIAVALLVASLIRFLIFVFFEVPLLAVVPVMHLVVLAFTHTLLVGFVFRIIRGVVPLVLEKWSRYSLYRGSGDTNTHRHCQNSGITLQIYSHMKVIRTPMAVRAAAAGAAPKAARASIVARFVQKAHRRDQRWHQKIRPSARPAPVT